MTHPSTTHQGAPAHLGLCNPAPVGVSLRKPARAVGAHHSLIFAGPIIRMDANVVVIRPNTCTGAHTGTAYPVTDMHPVALSRNECDIYDWS